MLMRHFCKVFEGLDVVPLLNALAVRSDLWNADPIRTTFPGSPHAACDDILLWFNEPTPSIGAVANDLDVRAYAAWDALPQAHGLIFGLMHRVRGVRLGRVIITRLAPGKVIPEHVDAGAPADFYSRYQIALQSDPGCLFHIADEMVNFRMGEAWLIDNAAPHSVVNNSAADRLALIVDIRTC